MPTAGSCRRADLATGLIVSSSARKLSGIRPGPGSLASLQYRRHGPPSRLSKYPSIRSNSRMLATKLKTGPQCPLGAPDSFKSDNIRARIAEKLL